jgi:hypothetical protein
MKYAMYSRAKVVPPLLSRILKITGAGANFATVHA